MANKKAAKNEARRENYKNVKNDKEYVLLENIMIPKGTVLRRAPSEIKQNREHFDCTISLSPNTCGYFTYCIDEDCIGELSNTITELK